MAITYVCTIFSTETADKSYWSVYIDQSVISIHIHDLKNILTKTTFFS